MEMAQLYTAQQVYHADKAWCWLQGRKSLPEGIDISQYVAGGIVVYNLRSRNLRWQTHLDLSTDHTQYLAYIYSAPTLVDINRDGKMEIIVGTSMVSVLQP